MTANGKRHPSHAGRVLSDYQQDYPCLYHAHYRFQCINNENGYEFQQPYFALNVDEGLCSIRKA